MARKSFSCRDLLRLLGLPWPPQVSALSTGPGTGSEKVPTVDPRQNRLFDPFDGVIPPVGRRIIADGWQGVFRHVLLEVMPVSELGRHFSDSLGAPTKELYSMAGLVFLADFFGWTRQDALEAYIFRSDVQYALNLEPGAASPRAASNAIKSSSATTSSPHASSTTSPPASSKRSISTSPDSGSTRPTSSATSPASAAPSSWPWRSSGS